MSSNFNKLENTNFLSSFINLQVLKKGMARAQEVTNMEIPIIDLSPVSLIHVDVGNRKYTELGRKLHEAFSTCGFAYLKNHGIPEDIVSDCMKQSKSFFDLPIEIKKQYRYKTWLKIFSEIKMEFRLLQILIYYLLWRIKSCANFDLALNLTIDCFGIKSLKRLEKH